MRILISAFAFLLPLVFFASLGFAKDSVASVESPESPASTGFRLKDFSEAHLSPRGPKSLVSARLSPSGIKKIRDLNKASVGKEITLEVAGVSANFLLREAIKGTELEMGPFSETDAAKVIKAINNQ